MTQDEVIDDVLFPSDCNDLVMEGVKKQNSLMRIFCVPGCILATHLVHATKFFEFSRNHCYDKSFYGLRMRMILLVNKSLVGAKPPTPWT